MHRAASLVTQLTFLGQPEPLDGEPVALAPLLRRAATRLQRLLAPEVKLAVSVQEESLTAWGAPEELEEMIVELGLLAARQGGPVRALRLAARPEEGGGASGAGEGGAS